MNRAEVINARDLARYYKVRRGGLLPKHATLKALDGATFTINSGETLAVVGESGCGKSTLARLVTMIEPPTRGEFEINGLNGADADVAIQKKLRKEVQIVFQDPYGSLNPRKKVGAILEEPLKINTTQSASERRDYAIEMMAKVGLSQEHYSRYPHMFSGGQRQRIAVARMYRFRPRPSICSWTSRTK